MKEILRIFVVIVAMALIALGIYVLYASFYVPSPRIITTSTPATITPHAPSPATTTPETTTLPPTKLTYEVVTTPAAQEQGLGGRANIPDNYAMLFVFPTDDRYGFWMKDMLTSIDMIWLNDAGTIILIDDSVSPDTYPHIFYPPSPVKYVLETRAGFATERGWTIGTRVSLPAPYGKP